MSKQKNTFIDPAIAEIRHVYCGNCNGEVLGHLPACPHCKQTFYANMHGYARLCKNDSCQRTETAGHAHGLCRAHHVQRKNRQAKSAAQPDCVHCGSKATFGYNTCSRCRGTKAERWGDQALAAQLAKDRAETPPTVAELSDLLTEFLNFVVNAPVGSGVCCCGANIADQQHDHTPVDQWQNDVTAWRKQITEVLTECPSQ